MTEKDQIELMQLLREVKYRIRSYMCSYELGQIGYNEGSTLLKKIDEFMNKHKT